MVGLVGMLDGSFRTAFRWSGVVISFFIRVLSTLFAVGFHNEHVYSGSDLVCL